MTEGEFKKRKISEWLIVDKKIHPLSPIVSALLFKENEYNKMIDEAKTEFLKIIKKPTGNDYDLGIPSEREQLDHDCELYELFVKWFGDA